MTIMPEDIATKTTTKLLMQQPETIEEILFVVCIMSAFVVVLLNSSMWLGIKQHYSYQSYHQPIGSCFPYLKPNENGTYY